MEILISITLLPIVGLFSSVVLLSIYDIFVYNNESKPMFDYFCSMMMIIMVFLSGRISIKEFIKRGIEYIFVLR